MANADIQMFMEKLKQLIYSNDILVINDNPSILCERPKFRLLHEELGSMIQTLFKHEDQDPHNLEKVRELKRRFKAAAEEAEDIVDLFLSTVHFKVNIGHFPISDMFHPSLHLDVVMQSLNSIKMEFMDMRIGNIMQMDSSQRPDRDTLQQMHSAVTNSRSRTSLRSKKVLEENVVGLGRDVEIIRDKLVEDGKHLDVVSIVGMGGLGKTTLANKVFTDPYVAYHFNVRGWVTVSQTYDKRDVLIQVLSSIDDELELETETDSQLRKMLHERLYRKRYLIVIDDIWSKEAWDKLKLFFPDHNEGSRILLTTRLTKVALHAKSNSNGLIHHLQHLTEEESWELLRGEVFKGDHEYCPEWLIEPGKQIAKNCHGLPLSVVVMAGVLAKEPRTEDVWVGISGSEIHPYIASDEKGCLKTIALSYDHLPHHLRDCFLYFGGFLEDELIYSPWLLWLWMAEGFIQEDGNRSWKEIAHSYLMDLVDRNLVIVEESYPSGNVRVCKVHDLVMQLCVEKGKEERFFLIIDSPPSKLRNRLCGILKIDSPPYDNLCEEVITTHKHRRAVTYRKINIMSFSCPPAPSIRSLLTYHRKTTLINNISKFFLSFALVRVLTLTNCKLIDFSPGLALLVHLRYLEIWQSSFPPSICNLWNLQTLILRTSSNCMVLPRNISNLVNLRCLSCVDAYLYLPSIEKPMELESISNVLLGDEVDNFQKCFPKIKKLTSSHSDLENDFEGLLYLEMLKLVGEGSRKMESVEPDFLMAKPEFVRGEPPNLGKNHIIRFPATLKELTLGSCRLPCNYLSIIQSLPNLGVLVLEHNAFVETLWKTGEDQKFKQLKILRLEELNIKQWEVSSDNFPCLQRLEVLNCVDLEDIPLELGEIPTLESIYVLNCNASLLESLKKIRQEQDDADNGELKIMVDGRHLLSSVPNHDD